MFALPHDNALIRTAIRLGQWFHHDALPIARPIPAAAVARPALESVPYTRREDAVALLQERRKDVKLRKRVEEFLGGNIPACVQGEDVAGLIFRNVLTPNHEFDIYIKHCEKINVRPVLFEYPEDKFVAMNKDKYTLARIYFYMDSYSHGENILGMKLVDFDHAEGKPLTEVKTLHGESLVSFHHRLLTYYYPTVSNYLFNATSWLHTMGGHATKYYSNFFALFLTHAILFENFSTRDHEAMFTKQVVLPAIEMIRDIFNINPIICPIHEIADENNKKWWTYPEDRLNISRVLSNQMPIPIISKQISHC